MAFDSLVSSSAHVPHISSKKKQEKQKSYQRPHVPRFWWLMMHNVYQNPLNRQHVFVPAGRVKKKKGTLSSSLIIVMHDTVVHFN